MRSFFPRRLIDSGMLAASIFLAVAASSATAASAADAVATTRSSELTTAKAIVLGVVEGLTEYLPVSSTGHLVVTERILDVGQNDNTRDATNSYTIIIQAGAIVAVVILYWRRILDMLSGLGGRSRDGAAVLKALVVAFIPAAVIGKTLGNAIEKHLLEVVPVAAAWIVGGIVIIALYRRGGGLGGARTLALEQLSVKSAAVIGFAQAFALWPGVSRSLVTILGGLLVGLSLSAAVEFSFLLGLATLTAATGYEVLVHGSRVTDAFGTGTPIVGIVAAFVSALVAVKWMVGYLNRHDLTVFGWYRIAAGIVALGLVATVL